MSSSFNSTTFKPLAPSTLNCIDVCGVPGGFTKTPKKVIVHVQKSDDVDEQYDTDNEIGPFFDQVMDQGELMIQEKPLNSTPVEISE